MKRYSICLERAANRLVGSWGKVVFIL